jgi:hypothetical protein
MTEVERQPAHSRRAALDETAQRLETELGEPQLATLALADVHFRPWQLAHKKVESAAPRPD